MKNKGNVGIKEWKKTKGRKILLFFNKCTIDKYLISYEQIMFILDKYLVSSDSILRSSYKDVIRTAIGGLLSF